MSTDRHQRGARRRVVRTGAALVLALLTVAGCATSTPDAAQDAGDRTRPPSFVVVMTDDLSWAEMAHLPTVQRLLTEQGLRLDDYLVNVPVCCPSRVTMFTGQYAHNTGVLRNRGTDGGWRAAHDRGLEDHMLGPSMQAAGYATGLYGRYLNGYPRPLPLTWIPPGWDDWAVAVNDVNAVLGYTLNQNGTLQTYGDDEGDYLTDVLFDRAMARIDRSAADDEPFMLWLNPYAPHAPAEPAARHADRFADLAAPQPPNVNEADVSDKPAHVAAAARYGQARQDLFDETYRQRVRSLQAVDENLGTLIEHLQALDRLEDTYVIFSSDNGFHLGHHRLLAGKGAPYEEDVRVPFVIRGPGIPAGRATGELVGNVDLRRTIESLAGVASPSFVDGRDATPVLRAEEGPWREVFLLEHWQKDLDPGSDPTPDEDGGTLDAPPGGDGTIPDWRGLRAQDWVYVVYATGERELYDLAADPFQLDNAADRLEATSRAELDAYLAELGSCAADTCRLLEERVPSPRLTP